jgi:hypothetical protein
MNPGRCPACNRPITGERVQRPHADFHPACAALVVCLDPVKIKGPGGPRIRRPRPHDPALARRVKAMVDDGMTYAEIGRRLGIGAERASRVARGLE